MGMKEVVKAIKKYDNYLITSHINAEGDAIGSELALFYLVKQLKKNAILVNNDRVPDKYKFFSGADKFITADDNVNGYENAIVVDCPTIKRSGRAAGLIRKAKIKINIDHHISNENFGDFNWVIPDASSCGEMVFNLYNEMKLNINKQIAVALYAAILTDTGSFRYDTTTCDTHRIVGSLIGLGVKPAEISERIYETNTTGDIRLLAKALSTIKLAGNGKIAYMRVTKKMLDDTNMTADRTDGFVNFARSIDGSEVSLFFREDIKSPRKIHVSFRSKGRANVNVLAGKFGGGGHPKASGCLIEGSLDEVTDRVLKSAEKILLRL
ncbi:MAG: bifunctional oligoribonuclease/PAP phosphatase NrnA [Candidatus Omnitrophota bacterium]|nr:bifunctional oligoribonuclease/PAP phosphatase NrnA [Candidatus Omnitrophota bacterium]